MTADVVFQTLTLASWPVAVLFVALYGFTAPWWKSDLGRGLFIKAVGVAIILTYSGLFYAFGPDYPGRDAIRIVGMLCVFSGLTYNTVNFARTQWRIRFPRA